MFLTIAAVATIGLFTGMMGCGEDEEEKREPANIIKTEPANGSLLINFDSTVTEVKVNGMSAVVAGTKATWAAQELQVGS